MTYRTPPVVETATTIQRNASQNGLLLMWLKLSERFASKRTPKPQAKAFLPAMPS